MSIFNLDLNQKLIVSTLLCQSFSLIECLNLSPANLDSCINIKNRVSLMLLLRPLNKLLNLILLLHLDIAIQQ